MPTSLGRPGCQIGYRPTARRNRVDRSWTCSIPMHIPALARVEVGDMPHWIAASSDNHFAYVTNEKSNDVSMVDLTTSTVAATIPVGDAPRKIVIQSGSVAALAGGAQATPPAQPNTTPRVPAPAAVAPQARRLPSTSPSSPSVQRHHDFCWTVRSPGPIPTRSPTRASAMTRSGTPETYHPTPTSVGRSRSRAHTPITAPFIPSSADTVVVN